MLVGMPGCGKSTIVNTLKKHFNRLYLENKNLPNNEHKYVEIQTLNPKSMDIQELYGYVDDVT